MTALEFLGPDTLSLEPAGWPESPFTMLRTPAGLPVHLDHRTEDGYYVLRAELPDLLPEDLEAAVTDDVLTLHADRPGPAEGLRRPFGSFTWSLVLPAHVDIRTVQTKYDQGVLTVRIPRPAPAASNAERARPRH